MIHTFLRRVRFPRDAGSHGSWAALLLSLSGLAFGQQEHVPAPPSRGYEASQTFTGAAYFKDNNVWGYSTDFAQLFGMPNTGVEPIEGAEAAAFRVEHAPYQDCGLGGRADLCAPVRLCLLDLYFDERRSPLPWATDEQSQWLPWYSSMRWLKAQDRREKPRGLMALDPPAGVLLNEAVAQQIAPFADSKSHRSAVFITNAMVDEASGAELSGSLALIGYRRNLYRGLSVVELQMGCSPVVRKTVDIWLDAKARVADAPVARFLGVHLPGTYISRINAILNEEFKKDTELFKKILSPR